MGDVMLRKSIRWRPVNGEERPVLPLDALRDWVRERKAAGETPSIETLMTELEGDEA